MSDDDPEVMKITRPAVHRLHHAHNPPSPESVPRTLSASTPLQLNRFILPANSKATAERQRSRYRHWRALCHRRV